MHTVSIFTGTWITDLLAGRNDEVSLYGSFCGLPHGRLKSIERQFKTIVMGGPKRGTFEFLNDCELLFQ